MVQRGAQLGNLSPLFLYDFLLAVEVGLEFLGPRLAVLDNLLPSVDNCLDVIEYRCGLFVPQGDNGGQSSGGN